VRTTNCVLPDISYTNPIFAAAYPINRHMTFEFWDGFYQFV